MENQDTRTVMSVTDWLIAMIITIIPIIGFIMLFVWAFGSGTNENKANWAKATLVLYAISIGLSIIFIILFGATLIGAAAAMQ